MYCGMLVRYCRMSGQLQRINGSAAKAHTMVQTAFTRMLAFAVVISASIIMIWPFARGMMRLEYGTDVDVSRMCARRRGRRMRLFAV